MLKVEKRLTDEELVERIKDGDANCLDMLVKYHLPRVHSRIHNLVPESDVDDVTQDVFVCLMDSISTFEGRSTFSTWFHKITMNKVADYHRKTAKRKEEFNEEEVLCIINPWEEMDNELAIEQILKSIPARYREILLLRHSEDMSFSEIADKLGLSYEATRSRYRRALILVRKRVRDRKKKLDIAN
ncbi:TPA: sigma-70 family RNA polymerase sigma factor [Candidatus Poribacteria bacterium]|nr:sigma-70 family RNA polymerase sigma factor [Candidatus Poribacteria bacterium]